MTLDLWKFSTNPPVNKTQRGLVWFSYEAINSEAIMNMVFQIRFATAEHFMFESQLQALLLLSLARVRVDPTRWCKEVYPRNVFANFADRWLRM